MTFKDERLLKERSFLDVDAGLVLKVAIASAVVAGAIFYVGLSVGKGELVKNAQGSVAPDMRALYQRVRQVKARAGDVESDKYFSFPSVLKRSASDGTEDDEVFNSLKKLLPASMRAHQRAMNAFEAEAAMKTLLARRELTFEDLDRARIPEDKKAELRTKLAALMKRMAAKGETIPRSAPAPRELLEDPMPLAPAGAAAAGEMFSPPPMDDSVGMVMIAPDESPAEAKRPSAPETAKVADRQSKRAAVSSRDDKAKGAKGAPKRTVGKFTVQLQAFQSRQEAEKFQAVMKADGYNTFLQKAELDGKGTWYRVRFGRFMTQPEAQQFKARFERDQGFVTTVMALGD